jgi:hypothetical protein
VTKLKYPAVPVRIGTGLSEFVAWANSNVGTMHARMSEHAASRAGPVFVAGILMAHPHFWLRLSIILDVLGVRRKGN